MRCRSDRARVLLAAVLLSASPIAGCLGTGDDPDPGTTSGPAEPGSPSGFSDTHVFEGEYATEGSFSRVLEEGPYEVGPLRFVELESERDGAAIELGLVRPETPATHSSPVVLDASVYYHQQEGPGDDRTRREAYRDYVFTRFLVENLVPHGYTVALVAARGTAGSGGCNDALGSDARADLAQAIGWLANRSWSNGRVGAFGFSSDATLAWNAASTGHPALRTLVPVDGWPDASTRLQRNGTWSLTGAANPPAKTAGGVLNSPLPGGLGAAPAYLERVSCTRTARAAQASAWKALAGSDDDPAGYWDEHDVRDEVLDRYDGSVFVVHGLRDGTVPPHNAYPWAKRLADEGIPVKQMYGRWAHDAPDRTDDPPFRTSVRWDFAETLLHWFDHWLKPGVDRDLGPRVQVQDTQGSWRSYDEWPPATADETPLHLQPDGRLARETTAETGSALLGPAPAQLAFAPNSSRTAPSSDCPGCVVLRTPPAEEPWRFAGAPSLDLTVTPAAPSGSVSAHVYVVDGEATYLTGGQLALRNADGDGRPDPPVPGRPVEARLALEPVDAVVPGGGRLVLVLAQGSWHHVADGTGPRDSAPLGNGAGGVPQPGPVRAELGDGQSTLTIDTYDGSPDSGFRPPGVGWPRRSRCRPNPPGEGCHSILGASPTVNYPHLVALDGAVPWLRRLDPPPKCSRSSTVPTTTAPQRLLARTCSPRPLD